MNASSSGMTINANTSNITSGFSSTDSAKIMVLYPVVFAIVTRTIEG